MSSRGARTQVALSFLHCRLSTLPSPPLVAVSMLHREKLPELALGEVMAAIPERKVSVAPVAWDRIAATTLDVYRSLVG